MHYIDQNSDRKYITTKKHISNTVNAVSLTFYSSNNHGRGVKAS